MAGEAHSIVEYFAEHESYRCGYCKSPDTNFSHGMWAHTMTVQDYQDLLNRGWRRSGKYTYKPTMEVLCCPMYTIKCEALKFKLRKSHKKVIKRINKYLIEGIKPKGKSVDPAEAVGSGAEPNRLPAQDKCPAADQETSQVGQQTSSPESAQTYTSPAQPGFSTSQPGPVSPSTTEQSTSQPGSVESETSQHSPIPGKELQSCKTPKAGDGADPNKPRCKKARELRKEKKLSKLSAKGLQLEDCDMTPSADTRQNEGKTLEELLSEPDRTEKCAHKLEVRLVRSSPRSQEFVDSLSESHSVYHRYQMCIHKDPEDKPSLKQYTRFLVDSPLEIRLVRSHPTCEEFLSSYDASYNVYKKYQMAVHKDSPSECDQSNYKSFLVDSPLEEEHEEGGLPQGYGSFHQQYILDGKIICVGVIDILPSLVSSKYLYYDPDYEFLSLGTYSALREIAFVRDLHKYSEKMIYYYMGFYIHSCPKMKYKGQFQPSYLLCPETYTWHPVEKCQPMLDKWTYCRFADKHVEDENGLITLDNVLVLYRRSIMTFRQYKDIKKQQNTKEDVVKEYAGFVGKTCAERMLLYRDN